MALLSRWYLLSLRFFISGRYVNKTIDSQMFLVLHFSLYTSELWTVLPQRLLLFLPTGLLCIKQYSLSSYGQVFIKQLSDFSDPDSSSGASWSSLLTQHHISVRLPQAHLSPHCQLRACSSTVCRSWLCCSSSIQRLVWGICFCCVK